MGLSSIGIYQLIVVLIIVLLVFGTKRIRNIGSDLGAAVREFRKGVSDDGDEEAAEDSAGDNAGDGENGHDPDSSRKP